MKCQQKQPFENAFFQAVAELLAIHNLPTPHIALSGYRSNKMPYLWQALYRSHTCTALALELREVLQEARNDGQGYWYNCFAAQRCRFRVDQIDQRIFCMRIYQSLRPSSRNISKREIRVAIPFELSYLGRER